MTTASSCGVTPTHEDAIPLKGGELTGTGLTHVDFALIRQTAHDAYAAGLCVLPASPDGRKSPALRTWREYQTVRPDEKTMARLFAGDRHGLGVVCGPVSGNLEMFEFDSAPAEKLFRELAASRGLSPLLECLDRGYSERTPGGGLHWLYRLTEPVAGSTKLASAPDGKTLIETRGEGGWVVVAPSGGKTHPTGRPYKMLDGSVNTIPTLTSVEHHDLWNLARSLDQAPVRAESHASPGTGGPTGDRPGDHFNTRAALVRHLRGFRCPVCGGHAGLPQGRGIRCAGFTLEVVTYCTREQFAGRLPLDLGTDPPTYKHHRFGRCNCGAEHGGPAPLGMVRSTAELDRPPVLAITPRGPIYERALDLLHLRPEALDDLTRRGLTHEQAHDIGYRSIPRRGGEHQAFLAALVDEFGEAILRECPGFTDKNKRLTFWTAFADRDGYVVPYRDEAGRVTGLQMKVLGGGYMTATGTHLDAVYHVAGVSPGADLYLSEGATKANVAHALGGISVFAVAGQSLKPSHIDAIKRLSPGRVIVALDEEDNARTDQARERWLHSVAEAGLPAYRAIWEGADVGGPKGIDDLLQVGGQPRIRAVHFPPSELGNRHRPYAVEQPGLVNRGSSLKEAREQTARAIDRFVGDAWKNAGKSQLVASSPGAGKSTALARSIQQHRTGARILVGTKSLAAELVKVHGYVQISGRGPDNCERPDVVRALGEAGHDVGRLACGTSEEPRCPARSTCGYWAQFQQPGPRVAASEQLYNPSFLAGGSLIVLDDAELLRSLVSRSFVPASVIASSLQQLKRRHREPARRVLSLLAHAVTDAPERPLIGSAVWDHLVKTATRYSCDLGALLRALPKEGTLPEPDTDADGYISLATVEATPPATLLLVLNALRAELPAFESGADFNSSLRLSSAGIDVWTLREPVPDQHGVPIAPRMALLVMDATPVEPLVRHVMRRHQRLPDVQARIRLPENVTVAQYASTSNGHAVLADEAKLQSVIDEVIGERAQHPVADAREEAVVVFKRHRSAMTAAGFTPDQVLTYGSLRGTNALTSVRRLHIVGRPMPPGDDLVFLAQVVHHDEAPISGQLTVTPRTYGGQRAAIDVIDFDDCRVSALLQATRDDELTQVIHRARLLTLQPQLEFGGGDQREHVRVVLHTNHVIPGLRVDELHVAAGGLEVNQQREQDAGRRIAAAVSGLIAAGDPLTVSAVARAAGAQRRTVAKALGKGLKALSSEARITTTNPTKEVGTPVQTVREDLSKGVHTLPQSIAPPTASHSSTPDGGAAREDAIAALAAARSARSEQWEAL